jgi:DNA-binding transcriptional LysR family regulator
LTEELVLNVTRLRVLRELAVRGSIAEAADALWLTPSAVSQQLTALERETHRKLIEKAGRGVRLTEAGKVLADAAEPVFHALEEASAALQAIDTEPSGRVGVASFPSIVRVVLPTVVSALRERYPHLVIEVEDLEGEQSLDALRLGRVDVAIVDDLGWDAGAKREGIAVTELFSDRLVVVVPSEHPLAMKGVVAWAEIAEFELITEQRDSLFAHTVDSECRRAGFEPRVNARVHDAAAMLAFVEADVSVAVLPELAVVGNRSRAIEWRPLEPVVQRNLLAATRHGKADTPAVRALIEELQRVGPAALERSASPAPG